MALGVVIQIDGFDPVTGAAVSLRASSHDVPEVCHIDGGATFWPAIAKLPKLGYDLFDGSFEGRIAAPSATIELATEVWPSLGRYALADARFQLWTGEVGSAWGAWLQRVDARVTQQPAIADGRASVTFAPDDRWLDRSLLSLYAGTTGIEGPAALKGQVKPIALGAPRYVPGVLVDPVNSVFQLSGYGAINGVEAALERLARFGPSAGNYATFAALVAAAIPPGRWATCNAAGLVRFGAPPSGQVSFLVQGDVAGPDGWARRPGTFIRRLALLSGGAGKVDDARLDALDAARPYNLSLYLDQQTTGRDLIQELAASVNAVAGVSWMGKLFVLPVAIGAPAVTLAADGSSLPPCAPASQLEMAAPFAKLAITAERTWIVHALGDVAFTAELVDMGAYAAGTTYREGNIVQSAGSSWLYINPTPASGNVPPELPTESDAYWKVLARAGEKGADAEKIALTPAAVSARYDGDGVLVAGQQTSFVAQRQNTPGSTYFVLVNSTGAQVFAGAAADFVAAGPSLWESSDPDRLNLTNAGLAANMDAHGGTVGRFGLIARLMGGVSSQQSISWITKVLDGAGGQDGAPGYNNATITIYRRSPTQPALPTATATWTFAPPSLADLNNGWSTSIPNGSDPVWAAAATASSQAATDTIAANEWTSPVQAFANGATGGSGVNTKSLFIYQRAASAPPLPSQNAVYTFSSASLTGLNNSWLPTIPDGTGTVWVSTATALSPTDVDNINPGEWAAVAKLAQDGAAGADGFAVDTEITFFGQQVYSGGANKPQWTGGTGTIRLNKGGQRITSGVTYAVLAVTDIASLSLSDDTFSFAGATDDAGEFTIRATYSGTNYDKVVSVKKVYDGEAAFRGSVQITGTNVTTATATGATTVPGGRGITISATVSYDVSTGGPGSYQASLSLYWRNITDNGPWNLLGSQTGSGATRVNTSSNPQEPEYVNTPGSVSAAFSFPGPTSDKQIGFEARVAPAVGNGPVNFYSGSIKLEVSS